MMRYDTKVDLVELSDTKKYQYKDVLIATEYRHKNVKQLSTWTVHVLWRTIIYPK